jgi:hypothetical protein
MSQRAVKYRCGLYAMLPYTACLLVSLFSMELMNEAGSRNDLRRTIAVAAAGFIADQGMSFGQARQRAVQEHIGRSPPREALPDQDELEEALREHLDLFDYEGHQERIENLRAAALSLMDLLAGHNPYVTGAAWKGIVSEHTYGHLQLFCEDPKLVAFSLIDQGLTPDAAEVGHFDKDSSGKGYQAVEALAVQWQDWPFLLSLYEVDDIRGALKPNAKGKPERGTQAQLRQLIDAANHE